MTAPAPATSIGAAFGRAIAQAREPAFRGIAWRAIGLSVAVFLGLGGLLWWGLSGVGASVGSYGAVVDWLVGILGGSLFVIVTWLLFPAIVSQFVSLFLDDVADAVERRYYPNDRPGIALGLGPAFVVSLKFTALLIALNLLTLPFYVVAFWIPLLNVVVFYALNGWLLAREYFDLVALRHLSVPEAAALRRAHRGKLFLIGAAIAFLLTVPVVNVIAAILGVAAMLHLFKGLAARRARA